MNRAPDMLRVASGATRLMEPDDAQDVCRFVLSRFCADGGFRGRAQTSDLYYTFFGGACLLALRQPPDPAPVRRYLEAVGAGAALDFVHTASLARCWAAMPYPFSRRRGRALLPRLESHRAADGGYEPATAGAGHGTIYGGFLAFLSYRETGAALPDPDRLLAAVAALRTRDGGYANAPDVPAATTTATAAAVLLRWWLAAASDSPALSALLACECAGGGFRASAHAPAADLLSTATALYALRASDARPARVEPHLDFVESLWADDGGFRGHPADPLTDCEYTFYALLALGCLAGAESL